MNAYRGALLALSRKRSVQDFAERLPATRTLVGRFVAGATVPEVVTAVARLRDKGLLATVDHLGERTTDPMRAIQNAESDLELIAGLAAAGLGEVAEVSVKPSAVGLAVPDSGERLAAEQLARICAAAAAAGMTVTVDMEDVDWVEPTLRVLAEVRRTYPRTGVAIQAYLRRSGADCAELGASGARVRLCKGAYAAESEVAFTGRAEIFDAYLRDLEVLLAAPDAHPMIASHDPAVITAAERLLAAGGRAPGTYEFQLLFGIRPLEQERLAAAGHPVRVYVPYGTDWYGYFVRRIAEHPALLLFLLRASLGRR